MDKVKSFFSSLFNFEPAQQKFFQLPFPLLLKCGLMFAGAAGMVIVGMIIAFAKDNIKPFFAGLILGLVFVAIGLWHAYLFTRKKYVRIFAYVARREKSPSKLSKEIITYVIFPNNVQHELLLGRKKLNVGEEYVFYFGQQNGTSFPNCNVLYGVEPAAEWDAQQKKEQELREKMTATETQSKETPTTTE